MRLVFMGTPDFSVPALRALIEAGHHVAAVYTQPPKPAGRGKKIQKHPVQREAELHGLIVRTPQRLRHNEEERHFLANLDLDCAVIAAYGLILPPEILALPDRGCLNIHASLLPRWRGASPIQSAIYAGDRESGISIMQMDEGLDTGDILLSERTPITEQETASTLHDRLSAIGARLILQALEENPAPIPQNTVPHAANLTSYAPRLTRDHSHIDWTHPAARIERQIRAFSPWPGSTSSLNGEIYRFGSARIGRHLHPDNADSDMIPGMIIDESLGVLCGDGHILHPLTIQKPGRSMMNIEAFLRGHKIAKGSVFV